jgi:4-amino-4-deoxy-L-arabinose transferase-like glycosyltransferase
MSRKPRKQQPRKHPRARHKLPPNFSVSEEFTRAGNLVKQNWSRLLLLLLLIGLTRLPNLTMAGLHYDEASYLYWGHVIGEDWSQRYIGAGWGGKQPLHSWLVMLSERAISDPVLAGRLLSAGAGAMSALLLWILVKSLFSERAAGIALLLYAICPYMAVFDRVALIDSLLTAQALAMLLSSVLLVRGYSYLGATGLALSLGAATLTKSVGWAFILLLPFSLLAAPPEHNRNRLLRAGAFTLGGLAGGALIYYLAFGSSEAASLIRQFEQQYGHYTMPADELLSFPWARWGENASRAAGWFFQYMTPTLAIVSLLALLASPWLGKSAWLLAAWVILPIFGQILVANRFFDRYILFSIPPLLAITATALSKAYTTAKEFVLTRRSQVKPLLLGAVAVVVLITLIGWPAWATLRLLTDVQYANERIQGFYGLYATARFLTEQAATAPLTLIVTYSPSPVQDGLTVLLKDEPNVQVLRVAPMQGKLAIFDPLSKALYPAGSFTGQLTYFADSTGAEDSSWLAGKIEPAESFSNRGGQERDVALYHIHFDDDFH